MSLIGGLKEAAQKGITGLAEGAKRAAANSGAGTPPAGNNSANNNSSGAGSGGNPAAQGATEIRDSSAIGNQFKRNDGESNSKDVRQAIQDLANSKDGDDKAKYQRAADSLAKKQEDAVFQVHVDAADGKADKNGEQLDLAGMTTLEILGVTEALDENRKADEDVLDSMLGDTLSDIREDRKADGAEEGKTAEDQLSEDQQRELDEKLAGMSTEEKVALRHALVDQQATMDREHDALAQNNGEMEQIAGGEHHDVDGVINTSEGEVEFDDLELGGNLDAEDIGELAKELTGTYRQNEEMINAIDSSFTESQLEELDEMESYTVETGEGSDVTSTEVPVSDEMKNVIKARNAELGGPAPGGEADASGGGGAEGAPDASEPGSNGVTPADPNAQAADLDAALPPEQRTQVAADQAEFETALADASSDGQRQELMEEYYGENEFHVEEDGTVFRATYNAADGVATFSRDEAGTPGADGAAGTPGTRTRITLESSGEREKRVEQDGAQGAEGTTNVTATTTRTDANGAVTGTDISTTTAGTVDGVDQSRTWVQHRDASGNLTGGEDITTQHSNIDGVESTATVTNTVDAQGTLLSSELEEESQQNGITTTIGRREDYNPDGTTHTSTESESVVTADGTTTSREVTTALGPDGKARESTTVERNSETGDATTSTVTFDESGAPSATYIERSGAQVTGEEAKARHEYLQWTGGENGEPKYRLTGGDEVSRESFVDLAQSMDSNGGAAPTDTHGINVLDPASALADGHRPPAEWKRNDDNRFDATSRTAEYADPLTGSQESTIGFALPSLLEGKSDAAAIDAAAPAAGTPAFDALKSEQAAYEESLRAAGTPEARAQVQEQYFSSHEYWIDAGADGQQPATVYAATYEQGSDPHVALARTGVAGQAGDGSPMTTDTVIRIHADGSREESSKAHAQTQYGGSTDTIEQTHYTAGGIRDSHEVSVEALTKRPTEGLSDLHTTAVVKETFDPTTGAQTGAYESSVNWDNTIAQVTERTSTYENGKLATQDVHEEEMSRDFSQGDADSFVNEMQGLSDRLLNDRDFNVDEDHTSVITPPVGSYHTTNDSEIEYNDAGEITFLATDQKTDQVLPVEKNENGARVTDENAVQLVRSENHTEYGERGGATAVIGTNGNPLVEGKISNHSVSYEFDPDGGYKDGHQSRTITETRMEATAGLDGKPKDARYSPMVYTTFTEGNDDDWMYKHEYIKVDSTGSVVLNDEGKPVKYGANESYMDPATGEQRTFGSDDPNSSREDKDAADKVEEWFDENWHKVEIGAAVVIGVAGIVAAPFSGGSSLAATVVAYSMIAGAALATTSFAYTGWKVRQGEADWGDLALAGVGVALSVIPGAKAIAGLERGVMRVGAGAASAGATGAGGAAAATGAAAGTVDDAGRVAQVITTGRNGVSKIPGGGYTLVNWGMSVPQIPQTVAGLTDGDITGWDIFSAVAVGTNLVGGPVADRLATGSFAQRYAAGRVPNAPDAPVVPHGEGGPDGPGTPHATDAPDAPNAPHPTEVPDGTPAPTTPDGPEGATPPRTAAPEDGAPLPGPHADSIPPNRLPADQAIVAGVPAETIAAMRPNSRHSIENMSTDTGSTVRPKNTVIDRTVDVDLDMAQIASGNFTRDASGNYVLENGRVYTGHGAGSGSDRMIPVSGPGVHTLERFEYRALQVIKSEGGVDAAMPRLTEHRPPFRPDQIERAAAVWNAHTEAPGFAAAPDSPLARSRAEDARANGGGTDRPLIALDPGSEVNLRSPQTGELETFTVGEIGADSARVTRTLPDGTVESFTVSGTAAMGLHPQMATGSRVAFNGGERGTVVGVTENGMGVIVRGPDGTMHEISAGRIALENGRNTRIVSRQELDAVDAGARVLLREPFTDADGLESTRFVGSDAGEDALTLQQRAAIDNVMEGLDAHYRITGEQLLGDQPLTVVLDQRVAGAGAWDANTRTLTLRPDYASTDLRYTLHEVFHGSNQQIMGDWFLANNRSLAGMDEGLAESRAWLHSGASDDLNHGAFYSDLNQMTLGDYQARVGAGEFIDEHASIPGFLNAARDIRDGVNQLHPGDGTDTARVLFDDALVDLGSQTFDPEVGFNVFANSLHNSAVRRYGADSEIVSVVDAALGNQNLAFANGTPRAGAATSTDPLSTRYAAAPGHQLSIDEVPLAVRPIADARRGAALLQDGVATGRPVELRNGTDLHDLVVEHISHPEYGEGYRITKGDYYEEYIGAQAFEAAGLGHMVPQTTILADGRLAMEFVPSRFSRTTEAAEFSGRLAAQERFYRDSVPGISPEVAARRAQIDVESAYAMEWALGNIDGPQALYDEVTGRMTFIDREGMHGTSDRPSTISVDPNGNLQDAPAGSYVTQLADGSWAIRVPVAPETQAIFRNLNREQLRASFDISRQWADYRGVTNRGGLRGEVFDPAFEAAVMRRIDMIAESGYYESSLSPAQLQRMGIGV